MDYSFVCYSVRNLAMKRLKQFYENICYLTTVWYPPHLYQDLHAK